MDFLEEEFDEILKIFQIESEEIISRINNNLLELEKNPNNKEAILVLFRDAHSLKGAARMIGFNNIQTIAHKIEDLLGLAKDNQLEFDTNIVDVLYKTVDFLSELIHKSIAKKQDVFSEQILGQISTLENIKNYAGDSSQYEAKTDLMIELLTKNQTEINNLISESLATLMQIEIEKDGNLIEKLLLDTNKLYDIFKQTGPFEIKKWFEDINVKLNFVNKASHILNGAESEELLKTINKIITRLNSIYELNNLEVVDYYSLAFDKSATDKEATQTMLSTEPEAQLAPHEAEPNEMVEKLEDTQNEEKINYTELFGISEAQDEEGDEENDLFYIQNKISTLSQNDNSLSEISSFLTNFENSCQDEEVKHILQTTIKILDFAKKNELTLTEDSVSVIEQSIEYCDNKIKNKIETADKELILQRLEIVQQLLDFNTEEKENYPSIIEKKYTIKNKKISDFSTMFDSGEIKTLRVDSAKLDTLINQVGELITTKTKTKRHLHELDKMNKKFEEWQRISNKTLTHLKYYDKKYFSQVDQSDAPIYYMVKQMLSLYTEYNKRFSDSISNISGLHRTILEDDTKTGLIIDDIENMVKSVRILPLATIFHLFGRMVRDIAQEKNKKINLEIRGSETSTDKKIIEEIKSPLIHIIRNAIDHGIETPEARIALGKNPEGKILLSARQVENKIIIEIQDDGKGLNLEKIKEKALHKGYLKKEELLSMTDEQISNIIFTPGFSTEEEITNISGRGIGMDVVKTKIAQLNGKVKVISEVNKGCCVQIELPTTMSTLKAFLVKASGQIFAIPMTAINVVLLKKPDEIFTTEGNKTIIFNEKTIPLYSLSDILNLPKTEKEKEKKRLRETVLIIESENKTIGLSVDKLIGDQEIMHKKLTAPLYKLKNISGLTTLPSGDICLILNVPELIKNVNNPKNKTLPSTPRATITEKNKNLKILLVDDSITTRTLEKSILSKAGYKVELATDPIKALEKMKNERFDLIISDLEMPEMNGLEFLSNLKTDEMYFDIPVIMVSSVVKEENRKRAEELGAEGYIIKGEFNQDDFLNTVISVLEKRYKN